ncbi:MAG: EamA family transporter [Candidatus Hydrogenedentota bacterium]
MPYVFVLGATVLSSFAHILFKRYAIAKNMGDHKGFLDYRFVSGVGLFGTSVGLSIIALYYLEFSVFFAITATNFPLITLFSYCFLGESIDRYKIIGNSLIICGVLTYCL